ncbi:MAG: branched-chain amino acid ABC transporter permease [Syntrophobacterales bacterium]|jgi:branched-chain amino acid transport system permease protein|nr:branched-chain amino acid ABC transporter permease [Syntrophobacterales bacterium]
MKPKAYVWPAIAFLLALFPLLQLEGYYYRVLSMIFLWVGLASAWNLTSGFTGYIDFGAVGYFGIGNYATALLMARGGVDFFPAVFTGGILSGAIALFIGRYTMKLRGAYFGIATLAFAEAAKQIVLESDRTFKMTLFEGSHGITLPIAHGEPFFYYTFLATAFLIVLTVYIINGHKFGYALKAIKEAEDSAELAGIDTQRCKVLVYALTSAMIGVLGGINAYWLTYISPNDVFSVIHTIQMIVMALLGGTGTVFGPVLGATMLSIANEVIGARFLYTYLLILGFIILFIVIFLPRGITGLISLKRVRK